MPVIAGTGSNSTEEAIDFTRHAKQAGANAALIVNPYYNKPTQEGLYRHFASIAEAVDIPIVILSTSGLDEDVVRSYQLGVNSFITKPVTFSGLVEAMNVLGRYWLEIVELPPTAA